MWDNTERDLMYQGKRMSSNSVGPQLPFMQSMRFPPPNNGSDGQPFAEASRKRKAMDTNMGNYGYEGVPPRFLGNPGHLLHREPTSHHNLVFSQEVVSQVNNPETFFNHNSHTAKPGNADPQNGGSQFYDISNSLPRLQTKDDNIKKGAMDSANSCSFHHEESSFSIKQPVEIPKLPELEHFFYDIATQSEPNKFQSFHNQSGSWMESSQAALRSNSGMPLGYENGNLPCSLHPYPYSVPLIMDSSHLRMVNEKFHPDRGTVAQDSSRSGLVDLRAFDHNSGLTENRNSLIGTTNCTQISAVRERRETYGSCQVSDAEVNCGNYTRNDILAVHMNLKDKEQGGLVMAQMPVLAESSSCKEACPYYGSQNDSTHVSKDSEMKITEMQDGSTTENKTHSLVEGTSPESAKTTAGRPVELDDELPLESGAGKVYPVTVEKLWDGTLQLNTSTTVSAFAIFKSGEKAQDINWPENVEIKGKVRLQAFEKFIQELPRSRNRSLMVISLCWNVGSSKAGLMGMKEVAKGYRETERVGFAQICPGIDLYVCPRSDTIITILAKYGFFKGMAAIEEDQDSLIGCIIWRRSQHSSNPNPKISEKKKSSFPEQQLNSPEPSLSDMNSPLTSVPESEAKKATPYTREPEGASSKDSSLGASSIQTNSVPELTPSIPYNSPLIPVQPPTSLQDTVKHANFDTLQSEEPRKPDFGAQPTQPALPGSHQLVQGVQQMNAQSSNCSHNHGSYNYDPTPVSAPLFCSNSLFIQDQLSTFQKPGLSSRHDTMERISKVEIPITHVPEKSNPPMSFESTHPALPAPPPLPPEILQKLIQFRKDACKAPIGGISIAEASLMHTGEQRKPNAGVETTGLTLPQAPQLLPQAQQRPTAPDDDDEDLPEFDFHSACGVPDAPVSKFSWSNHQTHFSNPLPLNKQLPVEGVKNAGGPLPPPLVQPIVKSLEVVQRPPDSSFPAKSMNTYPETTLPMQSGTFTSETEKPAASQTSQPLLGQPFTVKAGKDSFTTNFAPKNRWDDDDDDMPEWCPPDLENLNQTTEPNPTARIPSPIHEPSSRDVRPLSSFPAPSLGTIFPPLRSQGLSLHGYQSGLLGPRPSSPNHAAPVQTRPSTGFVQSVSTPRPSLGHQRNHSEMPRATKFNIKPLPSDDRWRRKRH